MPTDPSGQDQDSGLPLDFYGKSYLGKDVHVDVQGESPSTGAAGATPTGALGVGPTGAGHGPSSATGGGGGAVGGSGDGGHGLSDAMSGISAAQKLAKLAGSQDAAAGAQTGAGGLDFGPGTSLNATLPEGQAALLSGTTPSGLTTTLPGGNALVDALPIGGLNVADTALTTLEAGSAGAAGAEAGVEAASSVGAGPGALAALAVQGLRMAGVPIPDFGPTATLSDAISFLSHPTGAGAGNLGLSLATGGLSDLAGGIFHGPPPAMAFPNNNWTQLTSAVHSHLPQPLTAPEGATPEQTQAVEAVNKLITDIQQTYPTGSTAEGAHPGAFSGEQSAETWGNVINSFASGAQAKFKELQTLYAAAQKALQPSTTSAPAKPDKPETQVLPGAFLKGGSGDSQTLEQGAEDKVAA